MATNPAQTPTLQCKECEYQNEPERVYCHNCGAKLDRSVLPKDEQIRRESPDKARKRIMKMTNPDASVVKRELIAFVKTMVFAVLVAMVVQALRPPANLPPSKSEAAPRLLASDLGNLAESPTQVAGTFTEDEINTYLRGKTIAKGSMPGVAFKRAYLDLEKGTARIGVEKAIYGYSVYMGSLYRVEANNGVLVMVNIGGNVGRLPIHPAIMERVSPLIFGSLAEALQREIGLLQKMDRVTVLKDRVDLVSRGKR